MSTKTRQTSLPVSKGMAANAQALTAITPRAKLVLKAPDGTERVLPEDLQQLLMGVLAGTAQGDTLRIGRVSDELTSTVAAELLSISRPTLMKMVERGEINCFKVGTHTRFLRSEVERVQEKRRLRRMASFEKLRELDDEWGIED